MGRLSISTFYKFVLGIEEKRSTNEIIDDIINKSIVPMFDINGQKIGVLPIQHASGINPQYSVMLKNIKMKRWNHCSILILKNLSVKILLRTFNSNKLK